MDKILESSFSLTYALLVTTGTITLIEALRTKSILVRCILNLETCISFVAAYFYNRFLTAIETKPIDYATINNIRYLDWSITTPMMLLNLMLLLTSNTTGKFGVSVADFAVVLFLDYAMLGLGYMGENGTLPKMPAHALSFACFGAMFGYIYMKFMKDKPHCANKFVYLVYLVTWTLYGIAYFYEQKIRNLGYNVLDAISKCFVGIYFWAIFTKILF